MHNSKKRESLARCGDSLKDPHRGTASQPRTVGAGRANRRLRKLVADPNYPGTKELRGVAEKLLDLFHVK